MSRIGNNIRKIRTVKKMSQASFAEIFNLARPSIGAYEEGRAEPKIDTVIQIANYFGLSTDALLTKDLTINDLYRFDSIKKRDTPPGQKQHSVTGGSKKISNTVLINAEASWEYINNYKNADFLDGLPHYFFPYIKSIRALAFEMPDDSMSYDNAGIQKQDVLICDRIVEKMTYLKISQVYILITRENITAKRLVAKSKNLKFSGDHPDVPDTELEWKDLLEVWHVNAVLSQSLHPPIRVNERFAFLEGKIKEVADRLLKLETVDKK